MGFKLSADDEFNTENSHPKSPRHIFDEQQGSVEDDSLILGSKSSSEESTSIEKSLNDSDVDELTLETFESWRLEAVGEVGDTKIDEKSVEQRKLLKTRMTILKNNNQMDTNCPKRDFEFIIIVQGKLWPSLLVAKLDVGDQDKIYHQHSKISPLNYVVEKAPNSP